MKALSKLNPVKNYNSIGDFLANSLLIFFLPALLFYGVYFILPIPLSTYYSFFEWSGVGSMEFIGLDNWITLIFDGTFWLSFWHNLILVFASLGVQIPFAIAIALLLDTKLRGTKVLKALYFTPMLFSAVAIGIVWENIYDTSFGLLNSTLSVIGLEQFAFAWLGDSRYALGAVIVTICWRFIPFYMVIFMAAINGIPEKLYEAARIDGADTWQRFRYITLPSLKPTVVMAAILIIVGSLKYFPLIWVMTGGGPGHATELMATYMYSQAFSRFNMGYGSTIAVAMFLLAAIIIGGLLFVSGRGEQELI
ncbi:MAG: carbohydrate ABC transporter permease [Candidatus Acetothermia bacterium]